MCSYAQLQSGFINIMLILFIILCLEKHSQLSQISVRENLRIVSVFYLFYFIISVRPKYIRNAEARNFHKMMWPRELNSFQEGPNLCLCEFIAI